MKTSKGAPVDRGCAVGVIFFILGMGTLLPWNFFLTATKYFDDRLSPAVINGTVVGKEFYFSNWMTLLSQLPLLLFTLLNSFLYQWLSERVRVAGSLVFILLLFILTAALVMVNMEKDSFFSVTMATIWFINSFGAILQGSLFGLVGQLPGKYSAVFMSGQGLAGTFAAVAILITIASEVDDRSAALGYFVTPCVGTLITLLCYTLLPRLEFAQYYFDRSRRHEVQTEMELLQDAPSGKEHVENCKLNGHTNGSVVENGMAVNSQPNGDAEKLRPAEQAEGGEAKSSVMQVFRKIWVMAFCVTFVFTVTLSVFPVVTVAVKTKHHGETWERYFIPICCFLVFNVMDWFGRSITSLVQWPCKESRLFPALVVARVVFIPLLMMCNVDDRQYPPVWFPADWAFALIMVLFSASSGYCACLSMSYAPQLVKSKDCETVGALMTFFLALGLSLGAALSFPIRLLV
ncbi:equilibrative nucleoside transporter 2-like isoform X2 [Brienomyrus brachyistius]|nr:equilibrative nucleoside transporter 2-like isoform X2 [Brienomyrus brachyistius]XP_048850702.1 equilibrative nucleoside transporter 2-like isoform X2 [Brienomyrus brachyistius]XP_048850703.1 equilibrative nucleoside transporter 2-like isoform X2 [Brienomyrus brachyistius]